MTEREYQGLYGEIVTEDIYRMRDTPDVVSVNDSSYVHWKGHKRGFDFTPDIIFDLGANIGIFSRYCRELFPNCTVIAVEPDVNNIKEFKRLTNDKRIILEEKAIGQGQVWKHHGALNGAHECYTSEGNLGYREDREGEKVEVESIMLGGIGGLTWNYLPQSSLPLRYVLKLDIEGNETVLFDDAHSMQAIKLFDYIVMELHWNGQDAEDVPKVREKTLWALDELRKTHNVEYEHIYVYATKK